MSYVVESDEISADLRDRVDETRAEMIGARRYIPRPLPKRTTHHDIRHHRHALPLQTCGGACEGLGYIVA
jgi:hypothetical protein